MVRVLVLEDHDQMRQALVEALEDEGYEVVSATRGEEAVERASEAAFDLLITDIRMEGMDGLEALRHVRHQQPGIHSMVVTGYSTEDDSIRAIRLGAGDYLRKPFKLNEFLKRVNRLVAERLRQMEMARVQQELRDTCIRLSWGLAEVLDPIALRAAAIAHWYCGQLGRPPHEAVVRTVATRLCRQNEKDAPGAVQALAIKGERDWAKSDQTERVVMLALAVAEETEPNSLGERFPDRFDPFLVSLLRLLPSDHPTLEQLLAPARAERQKLPQLGRALEEAGDIEGARRAFRLLVEEPEAPEVMEGWLGLARLEHSSNNFSQAREHLAKAVESGHQRGASVSGQTLLRAALLSLDWGVEETPGWLKEASEVLGRVGDQVAQSEATLALAALGQVQPGETHIQVERMMKPENLPRLKAASSWIVRPLLEAAANNKAEIIESALLYLVREVPDCVLHSLNLGGLSDPAKMAALALVDKTRQARLEGAVRSLLSDSNTEVRRKANLVLSALASENLPPPLIVYSLGPFEVYLGDEPVEQSRWRTSKAKYLLAYLLARDGAPVSDDRLVEIFWPGPIKKGKRSLNTALSGLRKCLTPEGWSGELDYFVRGAGKVQFNTQYPYWHDLKELEKAADKARSLEESGLPGAAIEHHTRVAQLYRGEYLQECYLEWAQGRRTQLEMTGIKALTRVGTHSLETRRFEQALECGLRLVELNPCEEEGYKFAMQAYIDLGRHSQAVRLFQQCEKTLASELEMEPTIDLIKLHQVALLSQSSSLIG